MHTTIITTLLSSTAQSVANDQDSIRRPDQTTGSPTTPQAFQPDHRQPDQTGFVAYVVVMTVIVAVGLIGNILTIFVLRCREHKNKIITPLMINLALADIVILVFGYPVVVVSNFTDHNVLENHSLCAWSGFINGSVGIASIANLTVMSFVMLNSFNKVGKPKRVPTKKMVGMIIFTWLYGVVAMFPPLVGWNKFVPGTSGTSCGPNWLPETKAVLAYNVLLVFVGFVLPLTTILVCYYRIYRFAKTHQPESRNASIQASRKRSKMKFVRMIAMAIAAFVLSWSPYCFVSVIATIRGSTVLSPGEAEVPELLAKASVIYNPIVYTIMNNRFRLTLWNTIHRCLTCSSVEAIPIMRYSSSEEQNNHSLRRGRNLKESNK